MIWFFIIYILISLVLILSILVNGVRPTKTLAWMLTILTIPVGGMIFYLILGRNLRKHKLMKRQQDDDVSLFLKKATAVKNELPFYEKKDHLKLCQLILRTTGFPPHQNNKVALLNNGKATFDSIFKAIEQAQEFVHLEYYIFEEGELSEELFTLFERKLSQNVRIRILYDSIGSIALKKKYIAKLQKIGVEVQKFLPIRFGHFLSTINYRNHRKIIIVDDKIAFTGGINISDKYLKGDPNLGVWRDTHLKLEGPVVFDLNTMFKIDWFTASNEKEILKLPEKSIDQEIGNASVQIAASDPNSAFSTSRHLFLSLITEAKEYVYITNPYIIPGESILEALQASALSGVDVRLLLSHNSDSKLVKWCVRSYFESLLRSGVKIYLYRDGFVHSKTIVSDDTVSSIGTINLDIRSFEQNYEVNAVVYENSFARQLKTDFLNDCSQSYSLDYHTFIKRPWIEKFFEGSAKIFSPLL